MQSYTFVPIVGSLLTTSIGNAFIHMLSFSGLLYDGWTCINVLYYQGDGISVSYTVTLGVFTCAHIHVIDPSLSVR